MFDEGCKKLWPERLIIKDFLVENKKYKKILIDKKLNKNYWDIINNFKKITGIPLLLNTSFNRHGISTISSPRQAIEHLLEGCVDVLYLEGIEIELKKNRKIKKKRLSFDNENYLLMNTNLNWLKSNRKYLSKSKIIKFKSELDKKFKKIINYNSSFFGTSKILIFLLLFFKMKILFIQHL